VPLLVYLAGLTCTEETFTIKAGAQRVAAELGLALLMPDTSPRGAGVPGEADSWDFGVGAGFYLDATQAPWATHWRMESWLLASCCRRLAARRRCGGAHRHVRPFDGRPRRADAGAAPSGRVRSVSAFAPICAPPQVPLGPQGLLAATWAMTAGLGGARRQRADARRRAAPYPQGILSTRAWPTSSWPSSCIPKRSRRPAPPCRPAADAAPARRLRPRLLLHRQRGRDHLRTTRATGRRLSGRPNPPFQGWLVVVAKATLGTVLDRFLAHPLENRMQFKRIATAAALLCTIGAASAASWDLGSYTVDYDHTTDFVPVRRIQRARHRLQLDGAQHRAGVQRWRHRRDPRPLAQFHRDSQHWLGPEQHIGNPDLRRRVD
jgi:hypothetical protein